MPAAAYYTAPLIHCGAVVVINHGQMGDNLQEVEISSREMIMKSALIQLDHCMRVGTRVVTTFIQCSVV